MSVRPLPPPSPSRRAARPPGYRNVLGSAVLLLALLAAGPFATAQDARSLGMGGVTVAGPAAASVNPAFAAVPGHGGTRLTLPLGALSVVTRDYWDPNGAGFDALSTLDQASNLGLYLLDPAVSPDRVTVGVDTRGLSVTFQGGATLRLAEPVTFSTRLDLPIGGQVGPVHIGVRPFTTLHASFVPGSDTKQIFGSGSPSASGTLTADVEAGVALDVGTAFPLPLPPAALGAARVFAGVRGSAVAGLAKASADLQGQAQAEQDSSGAYTGKVLYSLQGTYGWGGVPVGTVGYGGEAALGLAASIPSGAGTVTAGVAVRHLGVMVWNLDQTRVQSDQSSSSSTDLGLVRQVEVARHVDVGANLALDIPSGDLGVPGMGLVLAADGNVDLSGGFATHAGAEVRFGPLAVRGGAGWDGGLRLGVGAGVRAGPVGLDVALTSHRSLFTDHQAYGLAASLGFGL
ncbi:MAG: hypothetical protein P8Y02_08360 [Deinococcales bacterium]|jgi:hypothetical protein